MKRIIISCLSLLTGCLLYILFRKDIIGFQILDIQQELLNSYYIGINHENIIYYFVAFCLGDGLWFLSLLLIQIELGQKAVSYSKYILITSILLPFILEFLQMLNIINGTFDIIDVLTYLLVIFILWETDNKFQSLLFKD